MYENKRKIGSEAAARGDALLLKSKADNCLGITTEAVGVCEELGCSPRAGPAVLSTRAVGKGS